MRERPILFNGPMVRAILDWRKTQTRRAVKLQRCDGVHTDGPATCVPRLLATSEWGWDFSTGGEIHGPMVRCPYGVPGDRLWVRETFNANWTDRVIYRADGGSAVEAGYASEPKWKPSIHMPRWASRITLEVTDVRVERIQDISEHDAIWEGCEPSVDASGVTPARKHFAVLWDSINAKRGYGWGTNPWVWVVTFRKLD